MQIPIQPISKTITADYYELGPIIDRANERIVQATVTTVFGVDQLVLWEGDAYDAIGNWTQEQALEKIDELLIKRHSS